jgi:hypothetical protein
MHLGYRAWIPKLDNNLNPILKSFSSDFYWEGPVASSQKPLADSKISERMSFFSEETDHELGLFSLNNFASLLEMLFEEEMEDAIMGITQPFGATEEYEKGYRSEHSQIIALCTYSKCAIASCQEPTKSWIVQKNLRSMVGFCEEHDSMKSASWMRSICGRDPQIIDNNSLINDLANRYQCDVIDYAGMINFKENYVTW